MTADEINVFEVLDNFFGSQEYPPAESLSNAKVRELREHVTVFYNSYRLISVGDFRTRLYLGGFLSSPPFSAEIAPYLTSALLTADSVILFDPLHYWFCDEQYQRPRLESAITGWKIPQTKQAIPPVNKQVFRPHYPLSKKYLAQALPWLSSIRPLVDAGIIVLIPAEQVVLSEIEAINQFATGMKAQLAPLDDLAGTFEPEGVTVDDNRIGLFVFAGGNRQLQIQHAIGRGIEHFAKDVAIANATGSLYTAPFKWEQHLGKTTLDGFAASECKTKVTEGIRNLRLPILSKLSPGLIAKIHKDSGYALFRAGLVEALQGIQGEIGSPDFVQHVQQIEADILLPKIDAINQEIKSSTFKKVTGAVVEGAFAFGQTFLSNVPAGLDTNINVKAGVVSGGLAFARKLLERIWASRDHRIWAQLLPDQPSPSIYGSPLVLKEQGSSRWDIDEAPSMSVKVSKGLIKYIP